MSEIKHTPGPWSVNTAAEYCGTRVDGPNGRGVAHAIQRDAHPVHGQGITQAEAEANGRLIAAAPELLQALRDLIGSVPGPANWHTDAASKAVDRAVAALAKATGSQS
jgi:hypothetical protein